MASCFQQFGALLVLIACALAQKPPVIVQLDKQYVPLKRGERVVAHKTAYFGSLYIGVPKQQRFTVVFDTGSGHVFVPSTSCASETCMRHKRYSDSESGSAVHIDHSGAEVPAGASERDQVSISFGTGDVLGEFVRDVVCLSEHSNLDNTSDLQQSGDCIRVRVITATEMTEEPFFNFDFDGVVGLGLGALAVDPEFSYFGKMAETGILPKPQFGFFLSMRDDVPSELSFGGHDERRVSETLQWAKVVRPELGYWQVKIKGVKIGGVSVPACDSGKCVGIVDSGTSLLGVPSQQVRDVHWKLARKIPGDPTEIDCRHAGGPQVVFDLGGFEISLGAEDYSRPTAMRVESNTTGTVQVVCRASLLPVDMGTEADGGNPLTWIFGEPVLRKYYTTFDWKQEEIGFALAKQPSASESNVGAKTAHNVLGAPSDQPQAPVHLQV